LFHTRQDLFCHFAKLVESGRVRSVEVVLDGLWRQTWTFIPDGGLNLSWEKAVMMGK
jgi:hypothetical protein